MPTRNVVLTAHQERLIARLVESGRYQNASEVLREGLRLIEARDAEQAAKLAALRAAVQQGEDDVAAGRVYSFESAGELDRHLRELTDLALGLGKKAAALKRDIGVAWQEADRGDFADYSLDGLLRELDDEAAGAEAPRSDVTGRMPR